MNVKYVTTVPLSYPVPQFDVSFPEKLLKIVGTTEARFLALHSPNNVCGRAPPGPAVGAKALPQIP